MKRSVWIIGVIGTALSAGGCAKTPADDGQAEDMAASDDDDGDDDDDDDDDDGNDDDGAASTSGTSGSVPGSTSAGEGSTGGVEPPPIKLDVAGVVDLSPSACVAPPPANCDHTDDDPWHAIGLNCPGGPQVEGEINYQGPEQIYVHEGNLGSFMPPPYPPREGEKFVILSSGAAQDLTIPGFYASTGINPTEVPLPAPIQTTMVDPADTCADNSGLIGTGDCSNTIQEQWDQGFGAHDYAEMRFTATVPAGTPGFSYDFAMFSTEYPVFYQSSFNDMYIAWLESEVWTGNVSFDDMGHPISLNAGFLDFKDAENPYDCPAPCVAPELQGTAMQGHAGTRWLTTHAGVMPGETIELVLAVFDLSDSILDTVMLIDNWHWECEGGPPVTIPG